MKAVICTRYGPPNVLQVRELPDPKAGRNDVVIRIRAATVTASDTYIRSGIPTARWPIRVLFRLGMGFTRPWRAIPGAVLAGEIESVGGNVSRFRVGDRVWAFTLMRMSCYAERIRLHEETKLLTLAPANLTHDEAAAIPYGGLLAQHFLRRANIQLGEQVLVYGASGSNGTAAVQLAKHAGARVTAVCGTANQELVRALGADSVLDYTKDEVPATRYDVVFDAVGRKKTSAMKTALSAARFVSVDDALPRVKRVDLERLKQLAEVGALKPVVDRRYLPEQAADAHAYVEQGHKRGNVTIGFP